MTHALLRDCLRAGTWASLAMMPFGLLFRALDLRIGHYGKRVIESLAGPLQAPPFQMLMMVEHFVIGWLSVLPLAWLWRHRAPTPPARLFVGLGYGLLYYLAINATLLPWVYGDRSPLELGWSTVYPSLVVNLVFGAVAAWLLRGRTLQALPEVHP